MQGFNMGKYVPPELEGVYSGNAINNKHALGSRAAKSSQGILTVRFEMPFPIWCTSCPKPSIIGQGVRFNAEKKKVGNYYSTPIFSFRMKHVACGSWIEIRTDPKNTAYVVHEGARKRDTGEDTVRDGDVEMETVEEREKRRGDAFASLEGKVVDKQRLAIAKDRLEELQEAQDQQWEDPYAQNRKLRAHFRVGRKLREKEAGATAALQDKMSLGLELLPENEDDVRRAGFVEFGEMDPARDVAMAISKPLFPVAEPPDTNSKKSKRVPKKLKAEQLAEKHRADLAAEIRGNTRAKMDPFLQDRAAARPPRIALGIKRKRPLEDAENVEKDREIELPESIGPSATGLVDYDSE